jgi:FMN reductase
MKYLVVSTSGNPDSNSRKMGRLAFDCMKKAGADCDWLDTRTLKLPMCDADTCYTDPAVIKLAVAIKAAHGILVAAPVYNFDVSASAKNMIELTGEAWNDKIVGFLCAAGGDSSYMSVMAYANSLMLDFRCTIVPRFVYATGEAFNGETVTDKKIAKRIDQLALELIRFVRGLRGD